MNNIFDYFDYLLDSSNSRKVLVSKRLYLSSIKLLRYYVKHPSDIELRHMDRTGVIDMLYKNSVDTKRCKLCQRDIPYDIWNSYPEEILSESHDYHDVCPLCYINEKLCVCPRCKKMKSKIIDFRYVDNFLGYFADHFLDTDDSNLIPGNLKWELKSADYLYIFGQLKKRYPEFVFEYADYKAGDYLRFEFNRYSKKVSDIAKSLDIVTLHKFSNEAIEQVATGELCSDCVNELFGNKIFLDNYGCFNLKIENNILISGASAYEPLEKRRINREIAHNFAKVLKQKKQEFNLDTIKYFDEKYTKSFAITSKMYESAVREIVRTNVSGSINWSNAVIEMQNGKNKFEVLLIFNKRLITEEEIYRFK